MTTLNVALIDQTLVVAEKIKIASGDIDSVFLAVEFDSSWDEFTNRSASFYTSHDSRPHERLLLDNQCVVPPEVLANPGILYVGVIGVKADGSAVKTSTYTSFRMVQGAEHEYTTVSPELNMYQQYLKATKEETTPAILAMKAAFEEEKAALQADYAEAEAEFKAKCVKACDYSKVLKTLVRDEEWIATEDCWVFGNLYSSYTTASNLKIDGVQVAQASTTSSSGIDYHPIGSFFVRKGSKVLATCTNEAAGVGTIKAYGCLS